MGASIHRSWALWSKWAKFLPRGNRYILPGALCDKYALLLQVASILTVAIAHLTLTCEECAIQPLENCVEHKLKREVGEKEAFDEERSTFMIKLIPTHKTSQWQYTSCTIRHGCIHHICRHYEKCKCHWCIPIWNFQKYSLRVSLCHLSPHGREFDWPTKKSSASVFIGSTFPVNTRQRQVKGKQERVKLFNFEVATGLKRGPKKWREKM